MEINENTELEVKILEINVNQVITKLEELGAEKVLDAITQMEGFDFDLNNISLIDLRKIPNRFKGIMRQVKNISSGENTLFSQEAYLRIREEGERFELILKFKLGDQSQVKREQEVSTEIREDEWKSVAEMLHDLGLQKMIYQEKKRVSYIYPKLDLRFDIDTWPNVPTYLEIEGPDEDVIAEGISLLGYEREEAKPITGREVFKKYNVDPSHLAFNKETL